MEILSSWESRVGYDFTRTEDSAEHAEQGTLYALCKDSPVLRGAPDAAALHNIGRAEGIHESRGLWLTPRGRDVAGKTPMDQRDCRCSRRG